MIDSMFYYRMSKQSYKLEVGLEVPDYSVDLVCQLAAAPIWTHRDVPFPIALLLPYLDTQQRLITLLTQLHSKQAFTTLYLQETVLGDVEYDEQLV